MALESNITKRVLDYLNSLPDCVAEKTYGSGISSGKPDINACYRGRSVRIEMKSPDHGNKASKKQILNLKKWKKAGALCGVCYSLEEVKKLLGIEE